MIIMAGHFSPAFVELSTQERDENAVFASSSLSSSEKLQYVCTVTTFRANQCTFL